LEHYKDLPYPRNLYAAFLSTTDERIGRLLQVIDDLTLRDNTIIVFQSDQGHSTEQRAHGGGGSAGPYRGAKGSLYEGGIRVPAIISWPGQIPENTVRDQMATGCDWYPTLLELCKLPAAKQQIDGKSLTAIIADGKVPAAHRQFFWKHNHYEAVRDGRWKVVVAKGKKQLYDIPGDPGEANDLAAKHPEVVARLLQAGEQYWSSIR
jgi:arylsulfatase A-like enzyme